MNAVDPTTAPTRILVSQGLFFDEITTPEQCDAVLDEMILAVAGIEHQIEMYDGRDRPWLARARHALRLKRMLMPKLQELRGRLKKERKAQVVEQAQASSDRILIKIMREIEPDAMWRVRWEAHQRHPDLFEPCDRPPALEQGL